MEQNIIKTTTEGLKKIISEEASKFIKKRSLLEQKEKVLKEMNECDCDNKHIQEEDLKKKEIKVVIHNWVYFRIQFNEYIQDGADYFTPLDVWKKLKLEVERNYVVTSQYPKSVLIPYKKNGSVDGDCIFNFQYENGDQIIYEYAGTVS